MIYSENMDIKKMKKKDKKKKDVKALIITGSGRKAFCSGQDLNELKNFKEKEDILKKYGPFSGVDD